MRKERQSSPETALPAPAKARAGGIRKRRGRGKLTALAAKLNARIPMEAAAAPEGGALKRGPRTRQNKKGLVLYVDPAVSVALRRLALDRGTSVQALGMAALNLLFEAHGLAAFPTDEGRP